MAKYGNYGWSPAQMERVNARRAARGQEELRNLQYEDRPQQERQRPLRQMEDEDEDTMSRRQMSEIRASEFQKRFSPDKSMKELAEERTDEFRKRFSPQKSMRDIAKERTDEFRKRFSSPKNPSQAARSYNRMAS